MKYSAAPCLKKFLADATLRWPPRRNGSYGERQSLFYVPTTNQTILNGAVVKTQFCAPKRKALSFTVKDEKAIAAPVVVLLGHGSPSAVGGVIVPLVIYSFQCMFRGRALAHVGQKVCKRFPPAITNTNAASAVSAIARIVRGVTAALHIRPDIKQGRGGTPVFIGWTGFHDLTEQAAAAPSVRLTEVARLHLYNIPTFTLTEPEASAGRPVCDPPGIPEHGQPVENPASQINELPFWVGMKCNDRILRGHAVFSKTENSVARLVREVTSLVRAACILPRMEATYAV